MTLLVILNKNSRHPVPRTTVEIPDKLVHAYLKCRKDSSAKIANLVSNAVGEGCWDMWTTNLLIPEGSPLP